MSVHEIMILTKYIVFACREEENHMKRRNRILLLLVCALFLSVICPETALANSAEPPGFVILVSGAPEDMIIAMTSGKETDTEPIVLQVKRKSWETYYRYYYHMEPGETDLRQAMLHITTGGETYTLDLPIETTQRYNNIVTLDWKTQTLTVGQPAWRLPLLIGTRLSLTLLIEGVVFWLFGYREKKSWIVFLVINLLTQAGLNISLSGSVPGEYGYWQLALVIVEVLVVIAEIVAYRLFLWEQKKSKGTGFAIAGNMASWALGALLMTLMPI